MLLMVASDRVSAFDVVMPQPIPRKGEVLTQITAWWLSHLADRLDHHLISVTPEEIEESLGVRRASRKVRRYFTPLDWIRPKERGSDRRRGQGRQPFKLD